MTLLYPQKIIFGRLPRMVNAYSRAEGTLAYNEQPTSQFKRILQRTRTELINRVYSSAIEKPSLQLMFENWDKLTRAQESYHVLLGLCSLHFLVFPFHVSQTGKRGRQMFANVRLSQFLDGLCKVSRRDRKLYNRFTKLRPLVNGLFFLP